MDAASSRRKQSRPARIEDDDDVSEKSPPDTPRSKENGVVPGADDDDRSDSSPVEIRAAGSVMGPIRVRRLASPLDTTVGAIATLLDASGNALFFEVAADEQLLTTVRPTASLDDANCVVMEEAPDKLRLMMTKSIPVTDTLIALYIPAPSQSSSNGEEERRREPDSNGKGRQRVASDAGEEGQRRQGEMKKYPCEQCNLASFNSIDNLRAHQASYCSKKEGEAARNVTPAPSMTPRPSSTAFPVPVSLSSLLVPAPGGMRLHLPPGAPQLIPGFPLLMNQPTTIANMPVAPASLPVAAPNVIYLPIGYHDIPATPAGNVVMMLGQPQTIVPIAVQRPVTHGAPLLPHLASSLAVHPAMCGTIPIPASLQLIAGDVITTIPVMAASTPQLASDRVPSATPQGQPPRPPPQNAPRTPKRRQRCSTPAAGAASVVVAAAPAAHSSPALDLSVPVPKRRRTHTDNDASSPVEVIEDRKHSSSSASSSKDSPHRLTPQTPTADVPPECSPVGTPHSVPPPPPKPFPCPCGAGFSTEATFMAHVTTYCQLTARKSDDGMDGKEQKRPPPKCGQCGYQPNSASQLAVHMRNHHAEAFICKLCGYRGFSVRGIRSHLRTHPELDSVRFDDLLGLHVTRKAYVKGRIMSEGSLDVSPSAPESARTLIDA